MHFTKGNRRRNLDNFSSRPHYQKETTHLDSELIYKYDLLFLNLKLSAKTDSKMFVYI